MVGGLRSALREALDPQEACLPRIHPHHFSPLPPRNGHCWQTGSPSVHGLGKLRNLILHCCHRLQELAFHPVVPALAPTLPGNSLPCHQYPCADGNPNRLLLGEVVRAQLRNDVRVVPQQPLGEDPSLWSRQARCLPLGEGGHDQQASFGVGERQLTSRRRGLPLAQQPRLGSKGGGGPVPPP